MIVSGSSYFLYYKTLLILECKELRDIPKKTIKKWMRQREQQLMKCE